MEDTNNTNTSEGFEQSAFSEKKPKKYIPKPKLIIVENFTEGDDKKTEQVVNRGTGAGGANTNLHGKSFEEKTNNQTRLIEMGYEKCSFQNKQTQGFDFYLTKQFEDKRVTFVLQNGLKKYMRQKYNIELYRCPDEAYIIEYSSGKKEIKILEKKEQHVSGSVETKLWAGPGLKREYEIMLEGEFEVCYGFCVSDYLQKKMCSDEKKYTVLNRILAEHNIVTLFGDEPNYFETINEWVNANE
jgi:hypothetical protein